MCLQVIIGIEVKSQMSKQCPELAVVYNMSIVKKSHQATYQDQAEHTD